MADARQQLLAELHEPSGVLTALDDKQAGDLLRLLHRRAAAERAALDTAITAALSALPRLVRIPARAVLFGK
ncbi:hypothetical protein [Nocardia sp. NPDC006630]|uniref:hypothetical protein n=1 Tax=Nocardia sp. NPDC006630 TaxID=3157181 RepID=UPI0033B1D841